jgi:hypothetical protein
MLGMAIVGFPGILLLGMAILLRISDRKLHCDLFLDELISSKSFNAIALSCYNQAAIIALSSDKLL